MSHLAKFNDVEFNLKSIQVIPLIFMTLYQAIADYNEAIRLNSNLANPHYNRGLIKKERGDKQEKLADFRKASEL